jgi:histidinol-phosphate/aromatic aminotransferase/cobyric acid decarboxylase-like protein
MIEGSCARYSVTPGLPRLREAIAETLARDGMPYDPDGEVLVTAGSIEAISASLLALVAPGDEVLVVSPTYASYIPAIRLAGAVPRFVPLAEDANFDLDPDAIVAAAGRRTRALILCNPNNPTGTIFSAEQTRRMLEVAERHDFVVIADEVYKDFLYGDARVHSAALETWARHRVLRVCSFSKAYAMTGWRVGFVHGPSDLIAEVLKVHDTLVTCAPVISQYAALAALEVSDEVIAGFRAEFRRRRAQVIERLDALPHVFDYQAEASISCSRGEGYRSAGSPPAPAADIRLGPRGPGARGAFGADREAGPPPVQRGELRDASSLSIAWPTTSLAGSAGTTSLPADPPPAAPCARLGLSRGLKPCGTVRACTRARTRPRVVAITGRRGDRRQRADRALAPVRPPSATRCPETRPSARRWCWVAGPHRSIPRRPTRLARVLGRPTRARPGPTCWCSSWVRTPGTCAPISS